MTTVYDQHRAGFNEDDIYGCLKRDVIAHGKPV